MPSHDPTRPQQVEIVTRPHWGDLLVFGVEHAQVTNVTGGSNDQGEYFSIGLTIGPDIDLTLAAYSYEGLVSFANLVARTVADRRRYGPDHGDVDTD